ncbi:MAG: DUF5591 domain-containing protein [Thermoplasmatales archaeon]|nr:DUF5591 domain-containing protein [Thermoplasmatales archaeon]
MTRSIRTLEGLGVQGSASVGGATFDVPTLIDTVPTDRYGFLEARPDAPNGTRHLRLALAGHSIDLSFPVLAPEIEGGRGRAVLVSPRIGMVHGPISAGELDAITGAELVVLANARALWTDGEPFVATVGAIRRHLGPGPVLWAPRVALPHRVPFLVYLGIDLVDTTEGQMLEARGVPFDESLGTEPILARIPAHPPGFARQEYARALEASRRALQVGRLRELVEARLAAEPALAEMLRYTDGTLGALLEERTAVVGTATPGRYVLAESLRRPEMRRFRARLIERYRPPTSKEVLLIVPCSRTKPYRRSRTHRRFAQAWEGLARAERLHVVSVSSPIGAERGIVREGFDHLVRTGAYRSIIVHLDPGTYGFLRENRSPVIPTVWTIGDHRTTSAEAIDSLRAAVASALEPLSPVPGGPLAVVREELAEIAAFQFGRPAAERLFATPVRLAGRPWFQRVTDGAGSDLATWREERGLFQLTIAGARRMLPDLELTVEVDPEMPLAGDVFVPGVRRASPAIRVGDAVAVLQHGELAAVGEAMVPGPAMVQLGRGLAVRLRHRLHPATETTNSEG